MKLDAQSYEAMLDFIAGLLKVDGLGTGADVRFIADDFWLQDTVVVENVERHHGTWSVLLVFAHHRQPLKMIRRHITDIANFEKATLTAHYMRRLAAKDQRGTLVFDEVAINFNMS